MIIEIQIFPLKENAFKYFVCEVAAILSLPQCVNYEKSLDVIYYGNT